MFRYIIIIIYEVPTGGRMNSAGSEDRGPGEWEEHSGKIPIELMYGDDEDYS